MNLCPLFTVFGTCCVYPSAAIRIEYKTIVKLFKLIKILHTFIWHHIMSYCIIYRLIDINPLSPDMWSISLLDPAALKK